MYTFVNMLKLPASFRVFMSKAILFMAVMTVCRIIFWIFNYNFFSSVGLNDFFQGMRFDAVTAFYGLLPVFFITLFLYPWMNKKGIRLFIQIYSLVIISLFAAMNLIDTIYYRFTLKRSTWDIFNFVSTGDDTISLIPQFLKDFWYMVVIWIMLFVIIRHFNKRYFAEFPIHIKKGMLFSLVAAGLLLIAARGGWQLRPLHVIDASRYTNGQNVPLVLSTPFSLMKTYNSEKLKPAEYYPTLEKAEQVFSPLVTLEEDSNAVNRNVVILIMESFSREYIGYFQNEGNYTPFLDSLMKHSMVFEQAYANGKRSIEALPAIFAGLPNLMNEAYRTSPYAGNKFTSLAQILKERGYHASFFHGGKNGTMGFDSFTRFAGFDEYFGMDEYPRKEDFDGSWGIYDMPYFSYAARQQSTFEEPFFSSIFSLSSHHPYRLPEGYVPECDEGALPILKMICYSDDALRTYFNEAKKQSWYENTVFLITADHTAQSIDKRYQTPRGVYAIPIILFDPRKKENVLISKTTQQTDITPTLLDYLGFGARFVSFGQSALEPGNEGFAVSHLSDLYQLIDDSSTILFDGRHIIGAYEHENNSMIMKPVKEKTPNIANSETKLKAIIQSYNDRMINNNLKIDE